MTSAPAGRGPGLRRGPSDAELPRGACAGCGACPRRGRRKARRPRSGGGGWGRATGRAGPAAYRGRSAGGSGPGAQLGLPPGRTCKGGRGQRRSPSSGSRGLLGARQASDAAATAAAAASGFMAKTPAPLPLPPPPPPRAEVPVTRRSTPRVRGRSPASISRHVPAAPGLSLGHVAQTCLPPGGCRHL